MKTLIGLAGLTLLAAGNYTLLKKVPVPGNGGWDYLTLDTAARRLYVSHGTEVHVLDPDAGTVVGKITGLSGVHGVAVVPEINRGFISNGTTDDVAMFDLKTLKIVGRLPTGKKPDAIIYDRGTKRVIADNNGGDSSTIIDAAAGKVTGTIELGGAPEFAAGDGKGKVFINLEDKSEVVKIDPIALKLEARWPLKPCQTPTGMAMDTVTRRLFIGCRSKVMAMMDADTGKVIVTLPIGAGVDAAAFDPATKLVYFSNGDGSVDIFHEDSPDKLSVVGKLQTEPGAKTMALDPKTHNIFLSVSEREEKKVKPDTFHVLIYGR